MDFLALIVGWKALIYYVIMYYVIIYYVKYVLTVSQIFLFDYSPHPLSSIWNLGFELSF